jgi:hypothetical protein
MVSATTQELIDQRLDALDRALLGLLPRSERLALVLDVEARIQTFLESHPSLPEHSVTAAEELRIAPAAETRRIPQRRRSTLAITAGVLGIVALVLLFLAPITLMLIAVLDEALDGMIAESLLAGNIAAVALGGAIAVGLGITALVKLNRSPNRLRGHGWAITGLCTGSLPMLLGGFGILAALLPMVSITTTASPNPVMPSPGEAGPAMLPAVSIQASSVPATPYSPSQPPLYPPLSPATSPAETNLASVPLTPVPASLPSPAPTPSSNPIPPGGTEPVLAPAPVIPKTETAGAISPATIPPSKEPASEPGKKASPAPNAMPE